MTAYFYGWQCASRMDQNHAKKYSMHRLMILFPCSAETFPLGGGEHHEKLKSMPPDKHAVKQLIADSSSLLGRLQEKSRASSDLGTKFDKSKAMAEAGSSDRPKTVVLEEALEFEVWLPSS